MPSRLSNEWFSIISITTCLISGMLSWPAGRCGNGRLSGLRMWVAASTTGLAQAGSPRLTRAPAPAPAAVRSNVRRLIVGSNRWFSELTARHDIPRPRQEVTRP